MLGHIDFTKKVGQSTLPDKRLRDLIMHFSEVRLRNEDFEFPDLLGAAYEYLIRDFADSAGKKGGKFYTPRSVVRMLVRIIEPQEGMKIYDPCSGSGGMLVMSKEYLDEHWPRQRLLRSDSIKSPFWKYQIFLPGSGKAKRLGSRALCEGDRSRPQSQENANDARRPSEGQCDRTNELGKSAAYRSSSRGSSASTDSEAMTAKE